MRSFKSASIAPSSSFPLPLSFSFANAVGDLKFDDAGKSIPRRCFLTSAKVGSGRRITSARTTTINPILSFSAGSCPSPMDPNSKATDIKWGGRLLVRNAISLSLATMPYPNVDFSMSDATPNMSFENLKSFAFPSTLSFSTLSAALLIFAIVCVLRKPSCKRRLLVRAAMDFFSLAVAPSNDFLSRFASSGGLAGGKAKSV
mmetsp:Transcript_39227/g.100527  ORF Transcript_39227/g.100527 Transcript_39227/m.100527 type:complete len:202 (-) Transcript_39227:226-831(-)